MSEDLNASPTGRERADPGRAAGVGVELSEEWERHRRALAEAARAFQTKGLYDVAKTLSKVTVIAHSIAICERQRSREALHGKAPKDAQVGALYVHKMVCATQNATPGPCDCGAAPFWYENPIPEGQDC